METQTLDGVTYPQMVEKTTTPTLIRELVKREGEFTPEQTHSQKMTLQHLSEGKVEFIISDEFGVGLYLTSQQKKLWDEMN